MTADIESTKTFAKGNRRVTYEWKLDDTHYAVLSVGHNKDRKCFYGVLRQEQVEVCAGYTSRSFMLFDGLNVGTEAVARYSASALEEFAARMRDLVEEHRTIDTEKVIGYFDVKEGDDA